MYLSKAGALALYRAELVDQGPECVGSSRSFVDPIGNVVVEGRKVGNVEEGVKHQQTVP